MKITAIVLSFAFLAVIGSTSDSYAGRRAQMSGYDATYHSTGRCKAGACTVKKPKASKAHKTPKAHKTM
jgi:hypothetical protein